ncbi:hypothetical protein M0R19_04050 [Candidatus Pacearchaeota archaeon]|jgi:hypothetical protein|nr:hypothetical protein [Candidatus Pacearchaeota archaeon]
MSEEKVEDKFVEYVKSIVALDNAIEPFREQKKDLRKEFVENGWLSSEDIKLAGKVIQLMRQDINFDNLAEIYHNIKQKYNFNLQDEE